MIRVGLILILALLLGCQKGGYDQKQMGLLTASEQKVVGKYKMEMEVNAEAAGDLKDLIYLLQLMEGGETTLECFPDYKFAMMVGDQPVTGEWALAQTQLTLRILKVGDLKPEQIARLDAKTKGLSAWSMSAKEREEFLTAYRSSIALERAEGMATMRVGTDGNLYSQRGNESLFGAFVSYFKRLPE